MDEVLREIVAGRLTGSKARQAVDDAKYAIYAEQRTVDERRRLLAAAQGKLRYGVEDRKITQELQDCIGTLKCAVAMAPSYILPTKTSIGRKRMIEAVFYSIERRVRHLESEINGIAAYPRAD